MQAYLPPFKKYMFALHARFVALTLRVILRGKPIQAPTVVRGFSACKKLGLVLVSIIAGHVYGDGNSREPEVHSRRLLQTTSANMHPCGIGPVCPKNETIKCDVGEGGGCICTLVHCSHPDWSGCSLYNGTTVTPCGF